MKNISRRSFVNKLGLGVGASVVITTLPSFVTQSEEWKKTYTGKKLNIALCGLGNYASMLASGIEISEYCHLAGIVTGSPEKALKWKAQYNIPDKNIYNIKILTKSSITKTSIWFMLFYLMVCTKSS